LTKMNGLTPKNPPAKLSKSAQTVSGDTTTLILDSGNFFAILSALATAEAAVLSALLSAVKASTETPKADDVEETTEDAEEDDAASLPFDPEAEVAEEPEGDDEPYFTVELSGNNAMVMKADYEGLKAGDVHELVEDDEGSMVPGKKPTVVVGGKKA